VNEVVPGPGDRSLVRRGSRRRRSLPNAKARSKMRCKVPLLHGDRVPASGTSDSRAQPSPTRRPALVLCSARGESNKPVDRLGVASAMLRSRSSRVMSSGPRPCPTPDCWAAGQAQRRGISLIGSAFCIGRPVWEVTQLQRCGRRRPRVQTTIDPQGHDMPKETISAAISRPQMRTPIVARIFFDDQTVSACGWATWPSRLCCFDGKGRGPTRLFRRFRYGTRPDRYRLKLMGPPILPGDDLLPNGRTQFSL